MKLDSCRWEPVLPQQSSFVFCARSSAFLIVDLTFHGQRHLFQVQCQPPCSDGLSCLGSRGSLHNRTGASFEVVLARLKNCSSKLCSVFGRFGSISLQQRRLHKKFDSGTATSYHGLSWSQIETVQLKLDSCRWEPGFVREALVF